MLDEPMRRLLDYDHRRYWLVNGWSVRFQIAEVEASVVRPHGIKYSFTYDNAHGVPRAQVYDHRHRFRQIGQLVAYEFRGADELLGDFFAAVERACAEEGNAFEFEADEIELEAEEDDDAQVYD